jgi:hypothetical protein
MGERTVLSPLMGEIARNFEPSLIYHFTLQSKIIHIPLTSKIHAPFPNTPPYKISSNYDVSPKCRIVPYKESLCKDELLRQGFQSSNPSMGPFVMKSPNLTEIGIRL